MMTNRYFFLLLILVLPSCNYLPLKTETVVDYGTIDPTLHPTEELLNNTSSTYIPPLTIETVATTPNPTIVELEAYQSTIVIDKSTPTPTHRPTLSQEEANQYSHLLMTKDICQLPCWGEIEPGITTWQEAEARLKTFATIGRTRYWGLWEICISKPDSSEDKICMFLQHDKTLFVKQINTYRYNYSLDEMLITYGEPVEVYLDIILDIAATPWVYLYDLALYYPQYGFIAIYVGSDEVVTSSFRVCLSNIDYSGVAPSLLIWAKDRKYEFTEVAKADPIHYIDINRVKKLEDVSDTDARTFYKIFKNVENKNKCIEVESGFDIQR
jgi:hypothetical protein